MNTTEKLAAALRNMDATLQRDGYHVDHSARMDARAALAEYDAAQVEHPRAAEACAIAEAAQLDCDAQFACLENATVKQLGSDPRAVWVECWMLVYLPAEVAR